MLFKLENHNLSLIKIQLIRSNRKLFNIVTGESWVFLILVY